MPFCRLSFVRFLVFGNYVYGLCAVLLCAEAFAWLGYHQNSFLFYLFIFSGTIMYYSKPYIKGAAMGGNGERLAWYVSNAKKIRLSQLVQTVLVTFSGGILLFQHRNVLLQIHFSNWILFLSFPFTAFFYYGVNTFNLRRIGWLKPFVIAYVWAGVVSYTPMLYMQFHHQKQNAFTPTHLFVFGYNFLFIAMLCILFDIKDYAKDSKLKIKTFIALFGLRNTIFKVVFPLGTVTIIFVILFGLHQKLSIYTIFLTVIPTILLLVVSYALRFRKKLLFYLLLVDGLMMVKAICGIIALKLA